MFTDPRIDPFPVLIPTEFDEDGQPTAYDERPHYNVTADFYAGHEEALSPYRVAPNPLARVWAGDDPASPEWTVALRFPDEEALIEALGEWVVEAES